jgi:cob(I)alamin adenosyltransferase
MARASTRCDDICEDIMALQAELIDVMTLLATPPGIQPPVARLTASQVERLERKIDAYEEEQLLTGQFIRPGGSFSSAALHLARTIIRRAERQLVGLAREKQVDSLLLRYLNRLSDLLYVMARIDEQREIRRLVMSAVQTGPIGRPAEQVAALTLATTDAMVEAGMRRAEAIGVPMVIAVVDAGGNMLEMRRMDGALLVSVTLAPHKAVTAAAMRMPTAQLSALAQPGGPLFGIDQGLPNITLVGGGLPVTLGGVVVGGVGVSGGYVEQDIGVAQAMLAVLDQGGRP